MTKYKFIVIKGKNDFVGVPGLRYEIFDKFEICCELDDLQSQQRKYVYKQLFYIDKIKNPLSYRRRVWCRRRHILMKNDEIFSERIKIFDFDSGIFYGFIPLENFIF